MGDGEIGVVINGRVSPEMPGRKTSIVLELTSFSSSSCLLQVVKPSVSRGFSAQDFSTLILHEINLRIGPVRTAVQGMYENLDVFDR